MTVCELVRRYFAHIERRGTYSTAESLAERVATLTRFVERFPDREVSSLAPHELTNWILDQPGWRSSSTRRAKANQVNRMMNWAAQERRIDRNPFIGAEPFVEAERRPCLDDASLQALRKNTDVPFGEALRFLRLCGCRFSDMAQLERPMVLWDQGVAVIGKHKTRNKTGRAKVIPVPPEAMDMLRSMGDGSGPIFRNSRGRPWTRRAFGSKLRRLKKKLGIRDGTAHGLRHQWGTVAYKNSGDIKLVSIGLGHRSVAITEKYYVHVDGDLDLIRKAAAAANR